MIRLPLCPSFSTLAAATALWLVPAAPLAAQQTFDLPPASPTPSPAPAGPADERAGVEIPPRPVPTATPSATAAPAPAPVATGTPRPAPARPTAAPIRIAPPPAPATTPAPSSALPAPTATIAPAPLPAASGNPPALRDGAPLALPTLAAPDAEFTDAVVALPTWQLVAIGGGVGALALLGAGALLWRRRRKPKVLHLAEPVEGGSAALIPHDSEPPRLDLALEITAATRSLMMFTLEYRLTVANRSARAVNDARVAAQLVCARASGGAGPSAGSAQGLTDAGRIGPHQARTVTGSVQLPLSAIVPLRQGQTPLFVPLVHVTLEGEGMPGQTKSFVIGTPSAAGRVHPIALNGPPGAIAGLVAQAVAIPAQSAAA